MYVREGEYKKTNVMQFNYDEPYNKKAEGFVEFESELAKLREETSLLYKNEYVKDFLENYHLGNNQTKENINGQEGQKGRKVANAHKNRAFQHTIGEKATAATTHQPYSYDIESKSEYGYEDDCFVGESDRVSGNSRGGRSRKKTTSKSSAEKNQGKGKERSRRSKGVGGVRADHNDGIVVFSRKYGSEDTSGGGNKYITLNIHDIKGDIVKSPKRNSQSSQASETKRRTDPRSLRHNRAKKDGKEGEKKQTILFQTMELPSRSRLESSPSSHSYSSSSCPEGSDDEYKREMDKHSKHHYRKSDEKIRYYLNQSSFEEENGEKAEEKEEDGDDKSGLTVSNSFLSRLPMGSHAQTIMASQKYEQNEKDLLMKRIQSLEVIESSQRMLILETQNKEQQYRIRSEELQKQLEYKDTKLLLLKQDHEILKRDFDLLKDEKDLIKKKFTEMEAHWNEEYGNLYKYKIDYEILSKQNETLMTEKNSFVNLIEEDKERYRKMELNHTNLLLNVDNLEKRNHEIVERCSKLQEDNDSLSREYNKLYQKYTSLLSEYGASKKNEENLNVEVVELQDANKKLSIECKDMMEKYKTLSATERILEQLQESNVGLIGEVSALKEERGILSADYKILEKKFKTSEESIHEMRNQLLDFTLENQKLKKLIKQTIIPLIPEAEYSSTIGHIWTVLNAKENSRMSIKVLEEEYLNNSDNGQCGKGKSKELQMEASRAWKGVESQFSPKKLVHMVNGGLSLDHQNGTLANASLSPKSGKSSPPKTYKNSSKLKDVGEGNMSPGPSSRYNSNLSKFEKLSPNKFNKVELSTRSLPVFDKSYDSGGKDANSRLYNSCPELEDHNHDKAGGEKSIKQQRGGEALAKQETFKRGVQVQTPRPFVADEDDHAVPVVLPKRLEGKIRDVLENEDKVIPVIPEDSGTSEKKRCDDIVIGGNGDSNPLENGSEKDGHKTEDCGLLPDFKGDNRTAVSDSIRIIDNYEKQLLLLNVEKVQLEAELSTLPKDNWSRNAKEKESKDNIERRIMEIQNSIIKASSSIKNIKEKQLANKDGPADGHYHHNYHHHHN